MMRRSVFVHAAWGAAAQAALPAVRAQGVRPVRLVLGAPAGTVPDTVARILGDRLGALWGQAIVIDNRPGVGGTLAMQQVKGAPPDGHTLMFAHSGAVVVTPKFLKAARYDPSADFTPLGYVADSPMLMVAGGQVRERTVAELVKTARDSPGKIAMGSTEQATLPYLVGHLLAQTTGVTFLHVPFNQPGQAAQALGTGDVQYSIDGIAPLLPLVRAGRVHAVALTTDRALPGLEGIALMKDTLPGFVAVGWFALLGPKGLPADLAARINQDLNTVLAQAPVQKKLRDISLFTNPKSQSDTQAFLKTEIDKWAQIIKKAGIEPM